LLKVHPQLKIEFKTNHSKEYKHNIYGKQIDQIQRPSYNIIIQ